MQPTRPLLVARPNGRLAWRFDDGTIRPYVGGGDEPDPEKTFSQADVDRIVQDRLARVKPAEVVKAPDDYDQLKAAAAELATLKAAGQTETEKLLGQIETLKTERDATAAERDKAAADARAEKRRSAVVAAAAKAKAVDPDDVYKLLDSNAVTIGDDGQVTGAEEAVRALLEAKPHLVGTNGKPKPDPAQGAQGDPESKGVAAGRERGRKDREAQENKQRDPFAGMTVVGRNA